MEDCIFVDEDASDSDVSLTSTAPSEARSEYPVDRILAEELVPPDPEFEFGDEGEEQVQYLVKWSGYPISRSTWEPRQNFIDSSSLTAWEERKLREQQGLAKPFDVDSFIENVRKIEARNERRRAKREAKREEQRLREEVAAKKRRRLAVEELAAKKRKVGASELSTPNKRQRQRLADEPNPTSNAKQVASTSKNRPATQSDRLGSSAAAGSGTRTQQATSDHDSDSEIDMVKALQQGSINPARPPAQGVSRPVRGHSSSSANSKSAPGAGEPSTPANVFTADWDKPKKKDYRSRLDNAKTLEDGNLNFANLAIQNRVTRWATSERAPDPSVLSTFNNETGKWEQPARPQSGTQSNTQGASTAPPPSIVNDSPAQSSLPLAPQMGAIPRGPRNAPTAVASSAATNKKAYTCPRWRKGSCKFEDSYCRFSHSITALGVFKMHEICGFWLKGRCRWTADECEYMHGNGMSGEQHICRYYKRGWCRFGDKCRDLHPKSPLAQATSGAAEPESSSNFRNERRDVSPDGPRRRQGVSPDRIARRPNIVERLQNLEPAGKTLAKDVSRIQDTPDSNPDSFLANHAETLPSTSSPDPPAIDTTKTTKDASMITRGSEVPVSLAIPAVGDQAMELEVRLGFESESSNRAALNVLSNDFRLNVQSMCLAHDFQHFCYEPERTLSTGDIVCTSDTDLNLLESFTDHLIMSDIGAVVRQERYLMVVFPASDTWTFLFDKQRGRVDPESGLCFYLQAAADREYEVATTDPTDQIAPANGLISDCFIDSICGRRLGLNKHEMLTFSRNNDTHIITNVFLMFPSRETPEALVITAWLLANGVSVYHADAAGAWIEFQTRQESCQKPGTVIMHPSLDLYGHMPNFVWVLIGPNNIFQVGYDPSQNDPPKSSTNAAAASTYSCLRLFPSSGLTLITDDLFEFHPGKAAHVLEIRERDLGRKGVAVSSERIITRPGLEDWLLDILGKYKKQDDAATRRDRMRLCHVVTRLPSGTIGAPVDEEDPPLLLSPAMSEFADYLVKWHRDEESATDWLVDWFQGECVLGRELYRRFMVIHEPRPNAEQTPGQSLDKDPRGWMKKFRHIKVMNYKRYCSDFDKAR